MNTLNFDKPLYEKFKKAFADAKAAGQTQLIFDGNNILTDYAKYMLEYLKPKFEETEHEHQINFNSPINYEEMGNAVIEKMKQHIEKWLDDNKLPRELLLDGKSIVKIDFHDVENYSEYYLHHGTPQQRFICGEIINFQPSGGSKPELYLVHTITPETVDPSNQILLLDKTRAN